MHALYLACFAKSTWGNKAFVLFLVCVTMAIASPAQTFTTLYSFGGTDGETPGPLVQAIDGNLYGTTAQGGSNTTACNGYGCGTAFQIGPDGALTTLYRFCSQNNNCRDGSNPAEGLLQATNGNLYGTTITGGADMNDGTVFKITPAGALGTVFSFGSKGGLAGLTPNGGLVQIGNGDLYGTTSAGGRSENDGTVFEITTGGTETLLHSFDFPRSDPNGSVPLAGLVLATDGNLYGTTVVGGGGHIGTVFRITPSGTLTTIYSFDHLTGNTSAALVQASNGRLYGTTGLGGANGGGSVFRITTSGTLTTLYSFCSQSACADGYFPEAPLIQATDGNLYGTTSMGGANNQGTIFKISPVGRLITLYSFCSQSGCTDGAAPSAGLIQGTDGNLYGTTRIGGTGLACTGGCGTVFSLSVGLGPFVKTLPVSAPEGGTVIILGTSLTGATGVTFNGTAATFTVVSSSEITTTVPMGATTGAVQVATPDGTLSSNINFRVTP
jgi:uncharacterized repeat protein (TIGR03803 family)